MLEFIEKDKIKFDNFLIRYVFLRTLVESVAIYGHSLPLIILLWLAREGVVLVCHLNGIEVVQ